MSMARSLLLPLFVLAMPAQAAEITVHATRNGDALEVVAVTEHPYERVESRAIAGNFREMRSADTLEQRQGRVLLRYTGRLVPDFFIPPLIGTLVLRRNVEERFRAMVEEIERQHQKPRDP